MRRLLALLAAGALASAVAASGLGATSASALLLDPGIGTGTSDGTADGLTTSTSCTDGSPTVLHVTATGSGFTAGHGYRLSIGSTVIAGSEALIGPSGISADVELPSLSPGAHTLSVTTNSSGLDSGYWNTSPTASAAVYAPCPTVFVNPGRLASRTGPLDLALTGSGWAYVFEGPAHDVVFSLDGTVVASAAASVTGTVAATAHLAAAPSCGSHVVSAQQPGMGLPYEEPQTATLVVTCPTLTPDPGTVPVESLPRPVTVTGDGWDPKMPVRLTVDGAPGPTVTTDGNGRLTTDLPLGVRPCGPVPITGVELVPTGTIYLVVGPPTGGVPFVATPAVQPGPPTATTRVEVSCPAPTPTDTPTPVVAGGGPGCTAGVATNGTPPVGGPTTR